MGTDLHQILRSLCFNSAWKYAVFWKLKHRARMVLTWEDGYYENCGQHDPSENKLFGKTSEKLHDGHYDPLGLAVAMMSYHVYSLGEGIVGQVAVTGKHRWITADKHVSNFSPSLESCDGWQTQFSAGIKTIVVVAVVPLGVVQLGSLDKVIEDVNMVGRIRDVFFNFHESLVGRIPDSVLSNTKRPICLEEASTNSSVPERVAAEVGEKNAGFDLSALRGDENAKLYVNSEHLKLLVRSLPDDRKWEAFGGGCKDTGLELEYNNNILLLNSARDAINIYGKVSTTEKVGVDIVNIPVDPSGTVLCDRVKAKTSGSFHNGACATKPLETSLQRDEEISDFQYQLSNLGLSEASLKFPAGYELHEALGPTFLKKSSHFDWGTKEADEGLALEMTEEICTSQLTSDSCLENLLEAVVANVCPGRSDVKIEKSPCQPAQSLSSTGKTPDPCSHAIHTAFSAVNSVNQASHLGEESHRCLSSSGICGGTSTNGVSSNYRGTVSEHLERSSEPAKNSKKRARPGENCRPRPRDRQLIQDRIKELRQLVPNGAKCSIDSLLERTIKHMMFLQGITKHADKLNKCANAKLHRNESGILGSSTHEQGSSWAVEVGGQLKVCSIIVENLNKNGQILVEMVCEESSHFLEIAEAIRSLGLTILKGVTEADGEKTWICFVVEGQDNRSIHRLDILWSLVQILQPTNAAV